MVGRFDEYSVGGAGGFGEADFEGPVVEGAAGLGVGRWTVRSLVFEGSIAAGCFGRARAVEAVFEAGGSVGDVAEAFAGDVEGGLGSGAVSVEDFLGGVVESFGVDVGTEAELAVVAIEGFMGDVVETLMGDVVEGPRSAVIVVVLVATTGTVVIVVSSSSSQSISSSIAEAAALMDGFVSIVMVVVAGLVEVGEVMEDCFSSASWRRATRSAFLPVCGRERDLRSSSSSAFFFLL